MTDQSPRSTLDVGADRRGPAGISWAWIAAGLLALIIVVLVGWWLWQGGVSPVRELRSTSLGTILEEPASLEDERIVVSSRVERLLTESAMTLGSQLVEGEVLVLTPPGVFVDGTGAAAQVDGVGRASGVGGGVAPFLEGQFVQITGTVRTFDAATMSEEYGLVLAPELFDPFEGEPAIITEVFDIAAPAPQIAAPVDPDVVDVGAVLAEPGRFAGQAVRMEGLLGEVTSDRAFTLVAPGAEGSLLVVGDETGRFDEVEPGQLIRVEGTILDFDEEALRQEGVDLGEGVDYTAFEGQPTVIPTLVEIVEEETTASPPTDESTPEATPAGIGQ